MWARLLDPRVKKIKVEVSNENIYVKFNKNNQDCQDSLNATNYLFGDNCKNRKDELNELKHLQNDIKKRSKYDRCVFNAFKKLKKNEPNQLKIKINHIF